MSTYEKTHSLDELIHDLVEMKEYHADIHTAGVRVQVLFYYDEERLLLRGIPAYAYVKSTSLKERALGQLDATMVVDHHEWSLMSRARQVALVDHELYHLEVARDKDNVLVFDDRGRPKLRMRKHDVEVGWFIRIAQEHKMESIEVHQATNLVLRHRQTLFEFALTEETMQRVDEHLASKEVPAEKVTTTVSVNGGPEIPLASPAAGKVVAKLFRKGKTEAQATATV